MFRITLRKWTNNQPCCASESDRRYLSSGKQLRKLVVLWADNRKQIKLWSFLNWMFPIYLKNDIKLRIKKIYIKIILLLDFFCSDHQYFYLTKKVFRQNLSVRPINSEKPRNHIIYRKKRNKKNIFNGIWNYFLLKLPVTCNFVYFL